MRLTSAMNLFVYIEISHALNILRTLIIRKFESPELNEVYVCFYRCIVNNEFLKKTKKSKEAKLTVISQSEGNGSHTPPSLYPQVLHDHWLLNGTNLSLACAASGYPLPIITWTFMPRYTGNPQNQ